MLVMSQDDLDGYPNSRFTQHATRNLDFQNPDADVIGKLDSTQQTKISRVVDYLSASKNRH
jgi:hypothetical protein